VAVWRRYIPAIGLPTIAAAMPIRPYLNGERFDPETTRVLGVALELVCIALHTGDCDDHVKQAIADKIIALAKGGERNPDILCERVLEEIRSPPPGWPSGETGQPSQRKGPG
jgi:hypothetical protein